MSMHKIPLTPTEEAGLRAHGLDIGKPSQLSDAFRQGVVWGQKAEGFTVLKAMLEVFDIMGDPVKFRAALAQAVAKREPNKPN